MELNQKPFMKGFKYRLYPTSKQKHYLANVFGSCRYVYNYLLDQTKKEYEQWKLDQKVTNRPNVNEIALMYRLPSLKSSDETKWLAEAPAQVLQFACRQLGVSYRKFFHGTSSFPKFKNKTGRQSATFSNQIYSIKDGKLKLSKCETAFKVKFHRGIDIDKIKSCSVSKNSSGEYYVSFISEYCPEKTSGTGFVGIDAGITELATLSNGTILSNPRHYVKAEHRLRILQRRLSRKKKGSKNRNKARIKVAKHHNFISNQRSDYIHKFTSRVISENQAVAIESLKIQNMVKNRHLAKHICDAAWGKMRIQLMQKTVASQHCLLVIADPFFPSTQLCNCCLRTPTSKIKLGTVKWICEHCGNVNSRDLNASKNLEILARSYYLQKQITRELVNVILAKPYSPMF